MRRTYLGILAAGLVAACGLDTAGDVAADAGGVVIDAGGRRDAGVAPGRDAGHPADATVGGDAGRETGAPPDDAEAGASDGATKDAPGDSKVGDGGSNDGGNGDAAADASSHDASGHDASGHDSGDHDAGEHDAGGEHDGGDGGAITQPPGFCVVDYSCGSASCSCNQTCAVDHCGPCISHYTTCGGGGTCGTDLSSIFSCGSCSTTCTCNPLNGYPSCNAAGSSYACVCNPY